MDAGNYDDIAALVRNKTRATAALVIVVDGLRGSGMSVRVADRDLSPEEADQMMHGLMSEVAARAEMRRMGLEKRDVPPDPGSPFKVPDLNLHEPGDDPDQRHLRLQVADEVEAVLKKYDVGGALLLVSKTSAAWRSIFPSWCGLQPDPVHVLRLRMKGATPEDKDNASATMHFIATIREMCSDYQNLYGRIWRMAVDALQKQGAEVSHEPLGGKTRGVGGRPDPMGGKVQ